MLKEEDRFDCNCLKSTNECNDMCIEDRYTCCQYCGGLDNCINEGIEYCDMVAEVVRNNA